MAHTCIMRTQMYAYNITIRTSKTRCGDSPHGILFVLYYTRARGYIYIYCDLGIMVAVHGCRSGRSRTQKLNKLTKECRALGNVHKYYCVHTTGAQIIRYIYIFIYDIITLIFVFYRPRLRVALARFTYRYVTAGTSGVDPQRSRWTLSGCKFSCERFLFLFFFFFLFEF